ncbi:MAG: YfcE family phosphodiesterase [Dehalococcoidia bacterium]|nr:YfcE family phosphodiesterase [Dehalococcoidia bacterium]
MTRIVVLADTHMNNLAGLPPPMAREVSDADLVVHCGDFTGRTFLDELQQHARSLAAVYGNTDGTAIRQRLPDKLVIDVAAHRIALIHPAWGGPPWQMDKEIAQVFPEADIILFGHTHEPEKKWRKGTLWLNPGQGYSTVGYPATYAILHIEDGRVDAEIMEVGK